jgi:hypothetical protein
VKDYMYGKHESFEKFNNYMQKANQDAIKVGGEVPPTDIGTNGTKAVAILKDAGIMGQSENLKVLTPEQIKTNQTLYTQAAATKVAANQGLDTFARMVGDVSKTNPGPGQSSEMFIQATWAKLTNTQRSEALSAYYQNEKNKTQALNAQINIMRQQGGKFIVGQKVLELEQGAIPDLNKMSPEASLAMAQTYINSFKQASGASDAILQSGKHLAPEDKLSLADVYAEKNPAAGKDGITANKDFQELNDFLNSGGKSTNGITGADKRAQLTKNTTGALADAKNGGTGAVPKEPVDPNIAAIQAMPQFKGATITKISK